MPFKQVTMLMQLISIFKIKFVTGRIRTYFCISATWGIEVVETTGGVAVLPVIVGDFTCKGKKNKCIFYS